MKSSIFVATLACVLSAALAFNDHKVEQVHSEVMAYVQQNMGDVRMMRGSTAHLMCYDDFIPLINGLATEAKTHSQNCISNADKDKDLAKEVLRANRAELALQVKRIQDSLTACTASEDGLGYFECLSSIVDEDKQILDNIRSRSTALISQYGESVREIDESEQSCLRVAVEDAKRKSDNAFEDLKYCIANGPPTPTAPTTTTEDLITTW